MTMTTLIVNGQAMQSHTRDDDPDELKPWREADDLIKSGKVEEAAELICSNPAIDPKSEPPQSTLVYRVFMRIMNTERVKAWLAGVPS